MEKKSRVRSKQTPKNNDRSDLGYVVDPLYGKLQILKIGDAGDAKRAFLVRGKRFGPDWREASELVSVHLTRVGRKKAELGG